MSARWSKWWWLHIDQLPAWSADERNAAFLFISTGLTALVATCSFLALCISGLNFYFTATLVISFLTVIVTFGRTFARMADNFFPDTTAKGDEAAAKRVGRPVYFPDESPGIWWASYRMNGSRSDAENFVIRVVYCVACPILLATLPTVPPLLRMQFGFEKRTSIIITLLTMLPLAFVTGRMICAWMWPDISKKADTNAWDRYNRRNRIRSLNVDGDVQRMLLSCERNHIKPMMLALESVCSRVPPQFNTEDLRRKIADAMIISAKGLRQSRLDFEEAGIRVLRSQVGSSLEVAELEQPWASLQAAERRP